MKAILAADKNWGIGYNNKLLVSIPSDMKLFRETTTGNVVVMGRKTLESFPNGAPLKNRMMLPYCDTVYVTKIDRSFQADTFFPNLDEMDEWEMTEEGEEQTCFDLEYRFTKYERK